VNFLLQLGQIFSIYYTDFGRKKFRPSHYFLKNDLAFSSPFHYNIEQNLIKQKRWERKVHSTTVSREFVAGANKQRGWMEWAFESRPNGCGRHPSRKGRPLTL